MTATLTGQTSEPFRLVTGMPQTWPITNAAGADATNPGNTVIVSDHTAQFQMTVPHDRPWKLIYHDGQTHSGTTPHKNQSLDITQSWPTPTKA